MAEPAKRKGWPWWVWLVIILFPIPIGVGPWWVAVIFIALLAVVLWAITVYLKSNSSE